MDKQNYLRGNYVPGVFQVLWRHRKMNVRKALCKEMTRELMVVMEGGHSGEQMVDFELRKNDKHGSR